MFPVAETWKGLWKMAHVIITMRTIGYSEHEAYLTASQLNPYKIHTLHVLKLSV